jgi:HEAT repeat protein
MEENENLLKRLLKSFQKQEGLDDLILMAEHWNGFKRENAVRRLGMLGNPVAIPKLIVRVNDWVPQVRRFSR